MGLKRPKERRNEMTFNEWLNEMFGTDVDACDIPEDDYMELREQWEKETA